MSPCYAAPLMSISGRIAAPLVTALVIALAGCSSISRPSGAKPRVASVPDRLKLDSEASPVPFRWLSDDAVIVGFDVGPRKLAAFGNYVARVAQKVDRAHLSVWDDEEAWKGSSSSKESDREIVHKRAEYVKDDSPPDPVERFLVFDRMGEVIYQRDFRSYPLTELD